HQIQAKDPNYLHHPPICTTPAHRFPIYRTLKRADGLRRLLRSPVRYPCQNLKPRTRQLSRPCTYTILNSWPHSRCYQRAAAGSPSFRQDPTPSRLPVRESEVRRHHHIPRSTERIRKAREQILTS